MRFSVTHSTVYHYACPVTLGPHIIRLRPRSDGSSRLAEFDVVIDPAPAGCTELFDHEGNVVTQAWFEGSTEDLTVTSRFRLETTRNNAFDWLPVTTEPLYPMALEVALAPYLKTADDDPAVAAFAAGIERQSGDFPLGMLMILTQTLFENVARELRQEGQPRMPGETLALGRGACRDVAVLFIEVCRRNGIAARFVSGYQRGDTGRLRRYLHAWPEVYLPNSGWRGFDPTRGLAVSDQHVALAAAAEPVDTTPIAGSFFGAAEASMDVNIDIHVEP
jgi:transglutaminase-like putative cysteine protease